MAAMATLELCREFYREDQRQAFFAKYEQALQNRADAWRDLDLHHSADPCRWKLWKRPSHQYRAIELELLRRIREARDSLEQIENENPLLVSLYNYKRKALVSN